MEVSCEYWQPIAECARYSLVELLGCVAEYIRYKENVSQDKDKYIAEKGALQG